MGNGHLPAGRNLLALAKITKAQKQSSLYVVFSAPKGAWRFLLAAIDLGIVADPEKQFVYAAVGRYLTCQEFYQ